MSRADLAHAIRRSSDGRIKATERGIRGWEKDEYVPRGDAIPAIASALGCETGDFYVANGDRVADDDEEAASTTSQPREVLEALYAALGIALNKNPEETEA